MTPLTLEHAVENNMTAADMVWYFDPDLPSVDVDFILWEQTCFPFSDEQTIAQLNEIFKDRIDEE